MTEGDPTNPIAIDTSQLATAKKLLRQGSRDDAYKLLWPNVKNSFTRSLLADACATLSLDDTRKLREEVEDRES